VEVPWNVTIQLGMVMVCRKACCSSSAKGSWPVMAIKRMTVELSWRLLLYLHPPQGRVSAFAAGQ